MANFNGIDYVVFALIFMSTGMGIFRGFIKEIISLISWVAAFVVATLYAVPFAGLFIASADHQPGANLADTIPTVAIIISYLALFFGILIIGSIIKYIVNYAIEGKGISVINRLLGAVLGFARGGVIVVLAMFFLAYTALVQSMLWKESRMVALFKPAVVWVGKEAQPYLVIIEDKIKKAAKSAHEEEPMPDVIQVKPAGSATGVPSNALPGSPVDVLPAPPAPPAAVDVENLPEPQPKEPPTVKDAPSLKDVPSIKDVPAIKDVQDNKPN